MKKELAGLFLVVANSVGAWLLLTEGHTLVGALVFVGWIIGVLLLGDEI